MTKKITERELNKLLKLSAKFAIDLKALGLKKKDAVSQAAELILKFYKGE